MEPEQKRGPGRPKGSKNKKRLVPPGPGRALNDFKYADPMTLIARQFSLVDWAQQALRNEMTRGMQAEGTRIGQDDIERLVQLSGALSRSVDALRKANTALEALKDGLTPAELLEAALKKIEGQDLPTINYAIKRLRAYRAMVAPVEGKDRRQLGETAADALRALEDE